MPPTGPRGPPTAYAPLHVHSDFSLLDGASHLKDLVARAVELGCPGLALTDHGVLYGAMELLRETKEINERTGSQLVPIVGNEMYCMNADVAVDQHVASPAMRLRKYHLIVLAKNMQGYRNLVRLTTLSHLYGVQGRGILKRPCVHKGWLAEHREGLIVTSACLGGEIPQALLANDYDLARRVATWFRDTFGDDFYLELQDHAHPEDRVVNAGLARLADELGIKLVATNDSHFTWKTDADAHDALICIQTAKRVSDKNRMRYSGQEYFKTVEEMRALFRDHLQPEVVDEALHNTAEVARKVQPLYELLSGSEASIPTYAPVPPGQSVDQLLRDTAVRGLERVRHIDYADAYRERLEHELRIISELGFASYFLIVHDYIAFARHEHIPVGPGRGSAAGSLVAYALRITDVDPIEHGLLFERFLNPERRSMPDIDTDFSVDGRERVIEYVAGKYGRTCVAQIITFNRLTSRAVLRDVARVMGIPLQDADYMSKLIPVTRGKPTSLRDMVNAEAQPPPSADFRTRYETDSAVREWVDTAARLEGTNKSYGVHAAGVVISSEPLDQLIPLSRGNSGEVITQYSMEDVERLGLLKMDFLGLRNLTIIEEACRLVRQTAGAADFDMARVPLDDAATYQLLARASLDGIFQMESAGMRKVVREMRPTCLQDISVALALYRPGPLDAGLIPKYIARKHGLEEVTYEHPALEPILKETYGILVYQEQIMEMARTLAGYSMGQADILRRAMGKKKMDEMQRQRSSFISGARAHSGVDEALAGALFEKMLNFADYCFNKSHSTAYAVITYQTAWLKANYPLEFACAMLSACASSADTGKLGRYLSSSALEQTFRVDPPSVNESEVYFVPRRTTADASLNGHAPAVPTVIYGLAAIKNLGEAAAKAIVQERRASGRPYASLADLCLRLVAGVGAASTGDEEGATSSSSTSSVIGKRTLEPLISVGAFDFETTHRRALLEALPATLKWATDTRRRLHKPTAKMRAQLEKHGYPTAEELLREAPKPDVEAHGDMPAVERLRHERELLGFYCSGHPLMCARRAIAMLVPDSVAAVVGGGESDEAEEALVDDVADGAWSLSSLENGDASAALWSLADSLPRTHPAVQHARHLYAGLIAADSAGAEALTATTAKLQLEDGDAFFGIVLLTAVTPRTTSKGDRMARAQVEDINGAVADAVVFPKTYQRLERLLTECADEPVALYGRVDRSNARGAGGGQIIVEDVVLVRELSTLCIRVSARSMRGDNDNGYGEADDGLLSRHRLCEALRTCNGSVHEGPAEMSPLAMRFGRFPRARLARTPVIVRVTDLDGHPDVTMRITTKNFVRDTANAMVAFRDAGLTVELIEFGRQPVSQAEETVESSETPSKPQGVGPPFTGVM